MTLRTPATVSPRLDIPMSYMALDPKRLIDCCNVTNNHGTQDTRNGIKRFLTNLLPGEPNSISFFQKTTGEWMLFAKVGTNLHKITSDKVVTVIKSGLIASDKHRGITENNRHLIVIGNSGFFITDGVKFGEAGQDAPTGVSGTVVAGGSLTANIEYSVGVTFYSSTTGYETNASYVNFLTATTSNKQINLSGIPAVAQNPFIDSVKIYLKNVTSDKAYAFVAELPLGTTTYSIVSNSLSLETVPTKNAKPDSKHAKFIALYGACIALAGDEQYPNEVELSESYMPDAYDNTPTKRVLQVSGNGSVTGLAVGFYNQNHLDPYLVIFKRNTITIYSELGGQEVLSCIDTKIGCVSSDTIAVRNGIISFMSSNGWYAIYNGQLIKDEQQIPVTLGDGAINDIFTRAGWDREINTKRFESFFSAYFTPGAEYMTFVSRAGSEDIKEAYVYDESLNGFRRYVFPVALTAVCEGLGPDGDNVLFLTDRSGMIYTYSTKNSRSDEDSAGNKIVIDAYLIPPYIIPNDRASTYNYRLLTVTAISSDNPIQIQAMASFNGMTMDLINYDYPKSDVEFVLDVSKLDIDRFGEEQTYVKAYLDLCMTGEALKLGFYQSIMDASIGLINMQLQMNKNGNNNT